MTRRQPGSAFNRRPILPAGERPTATGQTRVRLTCATSGAEIGGERNKFRPPDRPAGGHEIAGELSRLCKRMIGSPRYVH